MKRLCAAVLAAAATCLGVASTQPASAEAAAPVVTVYAGLKITPTTEYDGYCTLGAVGYDKFGNAIGITAGHCTPNGDDPVPLPMYAYNDEAAGVLGTYVQIDHRRDHDWAVIKFDKSKVKLVSTAPNGYRIDRIGTPGSTGTVACQNGATSGIKCGTLVGRTPSLIGSTAFLQQGDSGGPLSQNGALIGFSDRIDFLAIPTVGSFYVWINAAQVFGDIDAIGAEGTGFVPVNT